MTGSKNSDDEQEENRAIEVAKPTRLGGQVQRYDDTLLRAAQAADEYVQASIFAEYHLVKAPGTLETQRADLTLFSRFLAALGIERAPQALFTDAAAWAGMNASLLLSFRKWLLYPAEPATDGRLNGYSIGSVRRRLATVRQYCKLAFQSGVISPDEWTRIRAVKADSHAEGANIDADRARKRIGTRRSSRKAHPTPLSRQEFDRLRRMKKETPGYRKHDVILFERDALLLCLLGEHGLRVGEVVALERASINLRSNQLAVKRSKTHDDDVLPLLPATRRAAELYLALPAESGSTQGPLFTGYQGRRITRQGIYERVKDLGQLICVEKLSPHDLRHFFAKNGIEMDNPLNILQRYGGWKSGHMPLWYARQYGTQAGILKTGMDEE